ncbi:ATPase H+ transporting accessory protein 1a [Engraulis encrasicolus]|uniref:ATPase H+ transporting accessory protein 1a n=1 Tax=Engraulis encrasicolus TaxID=184585 RepID=UPI002FD2964B
MADLKMLSCSVVFVFLCCAASFGKCNDQVPLIMWTSAGSTLGSQTPPAAGHIVSTSQLESYLQTALTNSPHNVLLFLQDKLSMDDFTMYGGVFGNKQESSFSSLEVALQSSSPLLLPSVARPAAASVTGMLQEQLDTAPLYMDPETLAQLRLNASVAALLVFRLPYATSADMMSAKEVLSGNDEVIGQVLSIMHNQAVPYTAVYTGLQPSRVIEDASLDIQSVGGRSLLQSRRYKNRNREEQKEKEKAGVAYPPLEFKESESPEKPCIMLWAENLTVSILRENKWSRADLSKETFGESATVTLHGSFCNETHSSLALNYKEVLGFNTFKIIFVMSQRMYKVSARRWFTMDEVVLEYEGKKATFNGSRSIYAPAEYSYRCEVVTSHRYPQLVPRTSKDAANQWKLSFSDFQIQGFSLSGKDFSYASDCAGFFTPGIWMGLLTSLLMVLILTYGLHMIMQLRTMDRFDDPKGPAISVPQTE